MFKRLTTGVAASILCSGSALAASASNNLTNIVTIQDACDIVAIGIDFGITTAPVPAGGVQGAVVTNTGGATAGNAATGHPDFNKDGAADTNPDDNLTLAIPVTGVNALLDPVLATIVENLPGVYVACTLTPTEITVASVDDATTEIILPTTLPPPAAPVFTSKMKGVGGGAVTANTVDYTMTFAGAAVAPPGGLPLPIPFFLAAYTAVGAIPETQSGTIVPGFYTDVVKATVEY